MAEKKCTANEMVGANARVVLSPLSDREMYVRGLNNYKLPGMTRETITINDFERDFAGQVAGGGSYNSLTFSGNMISGDPSQDELQRRLELNSSFVDLWVFTHKGRGDFWAMDLARNACGTIQITKYEPQSAGKNDLVSVNVEAAVDGPFGIFNIHTDELIYTVEAGGVITATDGDFAARGFKEGMSLIFETGEAAHPYYYGTAKAVTSTTITLADTTVTRTSAQGKIHGCSKIVKED